MGHEKGKPIKRCFYKKFICATEVKHKTRPYPVGKGRSGGLQPHEEAQGSGGAAWPQGLHRNWQVMGKTATESQALCLSPFPQPYHSPGPPPQSQTPHPSPLLSSPQRR